MNIMVRLVVALALMLVFTACSTVNRIEKPGSEMSQMIVSGDIQLVGKYVNLSTMDGDEHQFRVTQVDTAQGLIRGRDKAVPISDVVAIEMKEADSARTALSFVGVVVFTVLMGGVAFL